MLEDRIKTDVTAYINVKRSKKLKEWSTVPTISYEDISDDIFDIIDSKDHNGSIKVPPHTGHSTYINSAHRYNLRFIEYEPFIDQFKVVSLDENRKRKVLDWSKGIGRADYVVYNQGDDHDYFIIHELSIGTLDSKLSKARTQLINTLLALTSSGAIKEYIDKFQHKLCIVTAKDSTGCNAPLNMIGGFMNAYKYIPDPNPINAKQITNRGFLALETRNVKLL